MGLTSNTGLLASVTPKTVAKQKSTAEIIGLRCQVTPAPFMLRPYAGLYNPFSNSCSVLCNHPADTEAKEFVKRAKDAWAIEGKTHHFQEDISKFHDAQDKDKIRTPHDFVTEDMFRRYAETDSRPLTPAPTLASGKSRGSRRCLTPDQPHPRTTIVVDLRRSHSQETLYYHGYTTSDMTAGHTTSATNDHSTLPSLNLSDGAHNRLIKGQCEQLPPLASPLVLSKRPVVNKDPGSVRNAKKPAYSNRTLELRDRLAQTTKKINYLSAQLASNANPNARPLATHNVQSSVISPKPENESNSVQGTESSSRTRKHVSLKSRTGFKSRFSVMNSSGRTHVKPYTTSAKFAAQLTGNTKKISVGTAKSKSSFTRGTMLQSAKSCFRMMLKVDLQFTVPTVLRTSLQSASAQLSPKRSSSVKTRNQVKALNLNKPSKNKSKTGDAPASQRSKGDKDTNDGSELASVEDGGSGERRRGKRRRKGRGGGSDRLTSAGLAAQTQQDPETQIAGIGTDSHNPSSRASIAPPDDDAVVLPAIKPSIARKTDSFLDDDILKFLHREVDEDAIETEFDTKRRYVLEEALRTRPNRPYGQEMQTLLKELKVPAVSLGDWLHIPRVFSRQSAQFTLPIDSNALENLTPMQYAARFVTLKKSKQLLYLTVLRKFRPQGYKMPIKDLEEGLVLMMGGILSADQARQFKQIMDWDKYVDVENIPDEIKLTLHSSGHRRHVFGDGGDTGESELNTIKYRTWCGVCAICERMYGRFPPREKDAPDGMELSDFTMIETRLAVLKVHSGLVEVLNVIRTR